MPKPRGVLIDELMLTVRVPADLAEADAEGVRRALTSKAFMARLRIAVRAAIREFAELGPAAVSVSR